MLKKKALTFATGETEIKAPLASIRHCWSHRAGTGADSQGLQGYGHTLPSCPCLLQGQLAPPPPEQPPQHPPLPLARARTHTLDFSPINSQARHACRRSGASLSASRRQIRAGAPWGCSSSPATCQHSGEVTPREAIWGGAGRISGASAVAAVQTLQLR